MPLVHKQGEKLVVLSGNHRTKASIAAGIQSIGVMEVSGDGLTPERLLALQLSHNAITGEDDENILKELYDSLNVMEKLYSGLTDADFGGIEDLDLSKLTISAPTYETVQLLFLPDDRATFVEAMERLGKGAAKTKRYIGRLDDYMEFERSLVAVQDMLGIHNQALALSAMSELALERLAQLEGGNADDTGTGEQSSEDMEAVAGPSDQKASDPSPAKRGGNAVRRSAKAERQPSDDLPVHPEAP